MFESDVVLEGTQTMTAVFALIVGFESDVVLEGTQTTGHKVMPEPTFESDVVLEGTQTGASATACGTGLRVMLF